MTWTPVSAPSPSWAVDPQQPQRLFSPLVFSHEFLGGMRVFSMGTSSGIWDRSSDPSPAWAIE